MSTARRWLVLFLELVFTAGAAVFGRHAGCDHEERPRSQRRRRR